MTSETQTFRREGADWKVKQIAVSSVLSMGAAIVGGTTVWAFLQTQFAPGRLTEYRLEETTRHVERLEEQVETLQKENQDLRIWFEQLKSNR